MNHRYHYLFLGLACVTLLLANTAIAQDDRTGFTFQASLGLAMTSGPDAHYNCVESQYGALAAKLDLAPCDGHYETTAGGTSQSQGPSMSLSAGAFIDNDFALLGHGIATMFDGGRGDGSLGTALFIGALAEYWPTDWFYVAGGPGLAVVDRILVEGPALGLSGRLGLAIPMGGSTLGISVEHLPAFGYDQYVSTTLFSLEWNLL